MLDVDGGVEILHTLLEELGYAKQIMNTTLRELWINHPMTLFLF